MLRALLINDTSLIGHHGSRLAVEEIVRRAANVGISVERGYRGGQLARFKSFQRWDLALVNGEGTLHHDRPMAQRLAQTIKTVSEQGVPSYIINSTIESNSADLMRKLTRAAKVFVRDKESVAECARYGIEAHQAHDLVLTVPVTPRNSGDRIVVTDSVDKVLTARLKSYANSNDYKYLTFQAYPPLSHSWRAAIKGGKLWSRYQFDRCLGLASDVIPDTTNFFHFLQTEVAAIISGRFHGICLAIKLRIPFLALQSNTRKVEELLKDAGLSSRLVSVDEVLEGRLPPPFSNEELRRIDKFVQLSEVECNQMFNTIRDDLASRVAS